MKLKQLFFIAVLFTSTAVQASQQVVQQPILRLTWEEHQDLCHCLDGLLPHTVAFDLIEKYGVSLINDYDFIPLVYTGHEEDTFIERIAKYQGEIGSYYLTSAKPYPWKAADLQKILEIPGVSMKGACAAIYQAFSSCNTTSDQLKKVELLIHCAGAQALYSAGNWLLVRAAQDEKIEEVRLLLEAGAVPSHDHKGYGTTFFEQLAHQPKIKKVYEEFLQLQACKQVAISETTGHLSGIVDLGNIVGDYFSSQPQISSLSENNNNTSHSFFRGPRNHGF